MGIANDREQPALNHASGLWDGIVHPRSLPVWYDQIRVAEDGKVFADFGLRQFRYHFEIADANVRIVKDKRKQPEPRRIAERSGEHSRTVETRTPRAIQRLLFSGFHGFQNVQWMGIALPKKVGILFFSLA